MRPWQDDPRFRCPRCHQLVYLTWLELSEPRIAPSDPPEASYEVAAICIGCQRVYSKEDWRRSHVTHHPSADTDA